MMITDKQKSVIHMIETNLQIRFKGETKEEARQFISANIEKSKQVSNQYIREMRLQRIAELNESPSCETLNDYFENYYGEPH